MQCHMRHFRHLCWRRRSHGTLISHLLSPLVAPTTHDAAFTSVSTSRHSFDTQEGGRRQGQRRQQQVQSKNGQAVCGLEVDENTDLSTLMELADLRHPEKWYLGARRIPRKIVLHVGPTNSGKTHHALKRLRQASSGFYCGPLRLLAWEVYERLNREGTPCNLVTGQERKLQEEAEHTAATIEMIDVNDRVECAVLDEVQMLGDISRGWAWTRVLLGMQADEIHCCGDSSAVPLIKRIAHSTGEDVEVRDYQRLSPLQVSKSPMRSYGDVQPGDCIVVFGRKTLFDVKREIEKSTGLRCGVIYGALPPAVRKEQAKRFNEGNSNDASADNAQTEGSQVLVATDAVGMGLNLQINRMIFSTLSKFDGVQRRNLTVTESKQIGGRAGRFGSAYDTGTIMALNRKDLKHLHASIGKETPSVSAAGVFPTSEQLELFAMAIASPESRKKLQSDRFQESRNFQEFSETKEDPALSEFLRKFYDQRERIINREASSGELLSVGSLLDGFETQGSNQQREQNATFFTGVSDLENVEESFDKGFSQNDEPTYSALDDSEDLSRDSALHGKRHVKFSQLLDLFLKCAQVDPDKYFLCDCEDMLEIAKQLDNIPMPLKARFNFCLAPVDVDDALCLTALRRYAQKYSSDAAVPVDLKPPTVAPRTPLELRELESAHSVFDLYLWLSRRFPNEFTSVNETQMYIQRTEQLIHQGLEEMGLRHVSAAGGQSSSLGSASGFRKKDRKDHRKFKLSRLSLPPEVLMKCFGISAKDPHLRPHNSITESLIQAMRYNGYEYSMLSNKQKKEARKAMKQVYSKFQDEWVGSPNLPSIAASGSQADVLSQPLGNAFGVDRSVSPTKSLKRAMEQDERGYLRSMMDIDWTNDNPNYYVMEEDNNESFDYAEEFEESSPITNVDAKIRSLREGARKAQLRRSKDRDNSKTSPRGRRTRRR